MTLQPTPESAQRPDVDHLHHVHHGRDGRSTSASTQDAAAGRLRTDRIVRINNLYWSGAKPHVADIHDVVADPLFVHPSTDVVQADFRLQATCPAIKAVRWRS